MIGILKLRHCLSVSAVFVAMQISFPAIAFNAGAGESQAQPSRIGKEIYHSACASCHGADGRGASKAHVGFDVPLPDFTDCNFATREPDSDWIAIARGGGPARAFSEIMPAFGDALSTDEIRLVTAHMRTFCGNKDWPRGDLNLPRPLVTEKAFPEDEAVYSFGMDAEGAGSVSNRIVYELRLGARNQFEVVIPFGWRERPDMHPDDMEGKWLGGFGDVAVGAKRVLFHSMGTGTIFSATGEIVLPTGDRGKGFGKGTTVLEPFVSFGQILPSELFFQSQFGFELPTDTDRAVREGFWRFTLGRSFYRGGFGRLWAPMVELLGARELISGEPVQWDVVPQFQVTLSRRQHIRANFGVRFPLTDSGSRNTQVLFYLLWDWFDGGLLSGW